VGRAALDAERSVHARALIALDHFPKVPERLRCTEGADHDAHPAADAALIAEEDKPSRIPIERLCRASVQARGICAMAALHGKAAIGARVLDPYPGEWRGCLVDRFGEPFIQGRSIQGAGDLAALAGYATFGVDEDRLHTCLQNTLQNTLLYPAAHARALRVKGGASCGNLGTQTAGSYGYQYFTLAHPVKDEAPFDAFCER